MADHEHYTPQQMAKALTESKGMMFLAAKQLGCSHETVRTYCKRYPEVQAAKDAQRGIMIDAAEIKLWQSIQNGEAWGISLCLRTLGRDRGYVERQEVTGADGAPLQITVTDYTVLPAGGTTTPLLPEHSSPEDAS